MMCVWPPQNKQLFIIVLGPLICPNQKVMSPGELRERKSIDDV